MLLLLKSITLLHGNKMASIFAWIVENYLALTLIPTSAVTIASTIAKVTKNETASKAVAKLQKVVDIVAMSSTPTELVKNVVKTQLNK